MSNEEDGPKRIQTEPTLVIDLNRVLSPAARAEIARAAERMLIDGHAWDEFAAREDAITMMACPACATCAACGGRHLVPKDAQHRHYDDCEECRSCAYCNGAHMVTPARAAAFNLENTR